MIHFHDSCFIKLQHNNVTWGCHRFKECDFSLVLYACKYTGDVIPALPSMLTHLLRCLSGQLQGLQLVPPFMDVSPPSQYIFPVGGGQWLTRDVSRHSLQLTLLRWCSPIPLLSLCPEPEACLLCFFLKLLDGQPQLGSYDSHALEKV